VLLCLFLAGCIGKTTRPSSFYVLSPEPGPAATSGVDVPAPVSVGLGPLSLPTLFDRPQIVTRPDSNRVDLAEYDRWGGDLNEDLGRVLVQNLMTRLQTDSVVLYPWTSSRDLDYQVVVQFFRFDGRLGEHAQIEGVWRLLDGRQGCELLASRFTITEQPDGTGYASFVAAISRTLAQLSDEIAQRIAGSTRGCQSSVSSYPVQE
jgi:uncharacterized lipoprotein YmbA